MKSNSIPAFTQTLILPSPIPPTAPTHLLPTPWQDFQPRPPGQQLPLQPHPPSSLSLAHRHPPPPLAPPTRSTSPSVQTARVGSRPPRTFHACLTAGQRWRGRGRRGGGGSPGAARVGPGGRRWQRRLGGRGWGRCCWRGGLQDWRQNVKASVALHLFQSFKGMQEARETLCRALMSGDVILNCGIMFAVPAGNPWDAQQGETQSARPVL